MSRLVVHIDCRHFKGDVPCRPHKAEGVHCQDCPYYDPVAEEILIIKLGARGDVIRTTPLFRGLKTIHPHSRVHWLTEFSDVLPREIDRVYRFNSTDLARITSTRFDIAINLDKDPEACALLKQLHAERKFGFILKRGVPVPVNEMARNKWETGIFDDINRANTLTYPQEIFRICGMEFKGEKYLLPAVDREWDLRLKSPVVGLNTGGGERWPSRIWSEHRFNELSSKLVKKGFTVLLLGGEDEDKRNRRISQATSAVYPGHYSLKDFFNVVNQCGLVLTGVTMALHVAIGLSKKVVLLNAIFNRHEFELYGQGEIIEPEVDCLGCYKPVCDKECINLITADQVLETIEKLIFDI